MAEYIVHLDEKGIDEQIEALQKVEYTLNGYRDREIPRMIFGQENLGKSDDPAATAMRQVNEKLLVYTRAMLLLVGATKRYLKGCAEKIQEADENAL